jgi:hypothetical protein
MKGGGVIEVVADNDSPKIMFTDHEQEEAES